VKWNAEKEIIFWWMFTCMYPYNSLFSVYVL